MDPITLSATGLPPGVVVDAAGRELRGVIAPGAAAASPYPVTVNVTDPTGASSSTTMAWTITPPRTTTSSTTTTTTEPPTPTTTTTTTTEPPTPTTTTTTTTEPPTPTTTTTTTTTTVPGHGSIAARVDVWSPFRCLHASWPGWVLIVVYGSADLDVRRIDRRSVALESMPASPHRTFALRWDVDRDGDSDLVVVATLAGGIEVDATVATVSGRLDDGTAFVGHDEICVTALSHHRLTGRSTVAPGDRTLRWSLGPANTKGHQHAAHRPTVRTA